MLTQQEYQRSDEDVIYGDTYNNTRQADEQIIE